MIFRKLCLEKYIVLYVIFCFVCIYKYIRNLPILIKNLLSQKAILFIL